MREPGAMITVVDIVKNAVGFLLMLASICALFGLLAL